MQYSVDDFWQSTFSNIQKKITISNYSGWHSDNNHDESYVEANLSLREGYDDTSKPIWLIAAPGAVGKSTLAKELCAKTGAIYLDLATAATVGGSCITGGLVYTNTLDLWRAGKTALVIDALDEARLRVTQPAFEDFLKDVYQVSSMGQYPIVLLGRVGIIEETWATISELHGFEPPIFNIELFDITQAKIFIERRLSKLTTLMRHDGELEYPHLGKLLEQHQQVYSDAIDIVIDGLNSISSNALDHFVGYAPVLDAITKVIALESNPSRLGEELRGILNSDVLIRLSDEILHRESKKLEDQLKLSIENLPENLYSPSEQLHRLACRLFKLPSPTAPDNIPPQNSTSYMEAVNSLLPQHPFLDGSGTNPSNAVFAAHIVVAALKSKEPKLVSCGESYSNHMHHAPNPFLFDFYQHQKDSVVPVSHVGLLYESVLAKSRMGEVIGLNIDESEDDTLDVEISKVTSDCENPYIEKFHTDRSGVLSLGRRVSNVMIDAEDLYVTLGDGDTLEIISPTSVNCNYLDLHCKNIIIKGESSVQHSSIVLEATDASTTEITSQPTIRGRVNFMVNWPNSHVFPWTPYSLSSAISEDDSIDGLTRVFRRIIMAFRSHSKGRLARYKDKIEHSRMLKGHQGKALLSKLQEDRIIKLEKHMYYLDANALGEITGASYIDVNLKRYSQETIEYIKSALK